MKKPKTILSLLGFIFIDLGVVFIFCGILNYFNILKTSPNSQANPAVVFSIIGLIFTLLGIIMRLPEQKLNNQKALLLKNGVPFTGKVMDIKYLLFIRWRGQNPYRVYYQYMIDGVTYEGKSELFWDKPKVKVGGEVKLLLKKEDMKQNCLCL